MPAVQHHHRQVRRPPLGLTLLSHLLEPFLGLRFGFASQALHQCMNDRVVHFTTPLARQSGRIRIRTSQRRREAQPLLHRRTHLLVWLQPPPLPNGATPMPIPRILSLPNHQFNGADDTAQVHRLLSPMMHLSAAEGEKLRLGGRLLLAVFALTGAASIRGLRLLLPAQCRAASAIPFCPSPSASFLLGCSVCPRTRNPFSLLTLRLWWLCQDAPPQGPGGIPRCPTQIELAGGVQKRGYSFQKTVWLRQVLEYIRENNEIVSAQVLQAVPIDVHALE